MEIFAQKLGDQSLFITREGWEGGRNFGDRMVFRGNGSMEGVSVVANRVGREETI